MDALQVLDDSPNSNQELNWMYENSLNDFLLQLKPEEGNIQHIEKQVLQDAADARKDSSTSSTLSLETPTLSTPIPSTKINELSSESSSESKPVSEIVEEKRSGVKRKMKTEEEYSLCLLTEMFLRIFYPISSCMSKNVVVGISKNSNFKPAVLLYHGSKSIMFNEMSWESLNKYIHLIECYFLNKVYGKKTCITLANSDIEVEHSKIRGDFLVKFRNISKHDVKILLTIDEFRMLSNIIPAVNRYIEQLKFSENMFKTYLTETIENQGNSALLYGSVDVSIYNRLPQEVFLYRQIKSLATGNQNTDDESKNPVCILVENKFLNDDGNVDDYDNTKKIMKLES